MKKTLRVKIFANVDSLCNFVNENHITQENIQTITTVSVNGTAYDIIYYWEFNE